MIKCKIENKLLDKKLQNKAVVDNEKLRYNKSAKTYPSGIK